MNAWAGTLRLDAVCSFSNGLWKGQKPPFVSVGVIRNINFTREGSLDDSDIAYIDVEAKQFEKRRLRFGDVILEKSGGGPKQPVGRVALFDKAHGDFSFSNFTAAIRVIDPDVLDFRFLHRFLHWTYLSGVTQQMQSHSTGIRNLNGDAYKSIEIPLPAPHEQQRIVGILDKAFEAIAAAKANTERNVQNARALFENYRESIFITQRNGWNQTSLAKICDVKHGFAFRSKFFNGAGKYVMLTPGNFFESGGYRDRGSKQKYYVGEIPQGYILLKNDLLVAMTEQAAGLLGSPILIPESNRFLHNQRLGLVTPKPDVPWVSEFFFHVFNTKAARQAIHCSASGVKVRHTSPAKLGELIVSYPSSVSEQRAIANDIDAVCAETQRLESIYRQKLAALEELKKSILHQAFSGAL